MPSFPLRAFNAAFGQYLRWRVPGIERTRREPEAYQRRWLDYLLVHARHTHFGRDHGLAHDSSYEDFAGRVPVRDYDGHAPYIRRAMAGERHVLWPGRVRWFSKSSGTTADRSKYLPVTGENLRKNHLRGGWDAMSLYYAQRPAASLFARKNLVMGGAIQEVLLAGARVGDISAVMLANFPQVGRPFYTPSFETMLMRDYEAKLARTVRESAGADVGMMGGVPNWTIALLQRLLAHTGAACVREVWPAFQLFVHGGIAFEPYRRQFERIVGAPAGDFDFLEVYNASEGYFGLRDELGRDDMLLLLDNGTFFEFVPEGAWDAEHPRALPLWEVEAGRRYSVIVTTNAGLWRYRLGDVVEFTSVTPHRVRIAGRTRAGINAFGEELMVGNADAALLATCGALGCEVAEYTAAPAWLSGESAHRGYHEWAVEFARPPRSLSAFAKTLDAELQRANSDYAAKRSGDLALVPPRVHAVAPGTFAAWMRARGRLGGQGKVPRLSGTRDHLESLLAAHPTRVARGADAGTPEATADTDDA